MLSNEKIPSESRLLVFARHRAQQHKPKRADSQFRRQARRPSKWQREGQPNKYLQEDGGQRTDRPSASSSTAKRTLDGLSPPPPPKHRDLVRLPCLLTPPLPSLASVLSPVREEASRHPLSSPPFAPPPPPLSLSLLLTPPLLLFLLLPTRSAYSNTSHSQRIVVDQRTRGVECGNLEICKWSGYNSWPE